MDTVQSVELIDKLVEAKIPKQTATELVDAIESKQIQKLERDLSWIKWIIGVALAMIIFLFNILHNRIDRLEDRMSRLENRMSKIEIELKEIKTLLYQLKK